MSGFGRSRKSETREIESGNGGKADIDAEAGTLDESVGSEREPV